MLLASKDIVFDVAHNTQSSGNASNGKGWGFNNAAGLPYGNYNQQGTGNGQTDTITGTQLSVGGNASLTTTQGNIALTASNIAAQGNVSLRAAGDLTIQSGQDLLGNANQSTSKGIGTVVISDTERFAGYNKKTHTDDNAQVTQVASNIGSLGGNVSLSAGGTYTQSASNVVAAKDVDITAASIQLLTANTSSSASQQDDDLKIGAFARIKSPLIDLINNVDDARKSDGRLGAMQGMAAAANAYQTARAVQSGSLLSVEAGVGFATSENSFNSASQLSQGSTITGGGNVSLNTTEGDLRIVQGNLKAGDTLRLESARDLVLEAGSSSNTEQSKGSNAGFEVGVGASIGAQTGVYAYVQASVGSHKSNVDGSTWQNTQLAGQNIALTSEGDTTLRGAVVKGDRIDAQTGGDLTIESLQDKLDIQSKESSVGGRVQVSFGSAWDVSGYASAAKANGNYLGVVEQSGLFAGNGGYHVTAGNVNLIGGAIASTNAGASELTADALTFTDLKNRMDYSASSGSISGGFGSTGNQTDANGNPVQKSAGEQSRDIGNTIANGDYGKANTGSFMPGVPMHESGSDTTDTRATLTEGTIKIGGKTTTAAATGINTDATAAHEAVATLPDVRKILGEQQAMAAAASTVIATGRQIGQDIAASAENKARAIEDQYRNDLKTDDDRNRFAALTPAQRESELLQKVPDYRAAYESKQQWGTGGDYSRALQAVTTVLVGSVAGQGASQVAGNALAPYAAQLVGKTFDQNHGSNPNAVLQGLSHAVLGAVLAQVNGTSMTGGALAGAGGELAAQYLTKTLYGDDPQAYGPDGKFDPNRLPDADKQMIVSLSQAVGAIAGGMTGGSLADAATTAHIAKNSVENNFLGKDDHARLKELRQKAEAQYGLNPHESLELVLLDAGDQMSAGLLKKVLAGENLTDVQEADLATYYQRYIDQNGSFDLNNLQGIGPDQVYGFPYAGLSVDQRAYASTNFTFMERLFGRDKTVNDSIYNAALIKSGIEVTRSEDLLPSSMQLRSFFALHDSLSSSALASIGYLGATAAGMSEENRRNVANTIAGATQIVGSIVSPKTSLLPGTGGLGVPRAPVPRYVEEVSPNTLVITSKNPVASNGYGVPREPVPRSVEEAPPNTTITTSKNPTASSSEVPPNQPTEEPAFSSSRPLALPSPNFNVPSGYTASKNADGTATVTGPRGGIYDSTGRYTDDGKPIFRDNNGGYVTLEGGRVSVRAPPNYDTIPIHHICTDKCNSDANGREAWTPQFQRFFDGSGLDIKRAKENLVAVPGHRGPHPDDYHRYVYGMLDDATSGLTPNTPAYKMAVTQTLSRIKAEAQIKGSQVNRWLTGD